MEQRIEEVLNEIFGRGIDRCTEEEIQQGLLVLTKEEMAKRPAVSGKKRFTIYQLSF